MSGGQGPEPLPRNVKDIKQGVLYTVVPQGHTIQKSKEKIQLFNRPVEFAMPDFSRQRHPALDRELFKEIAPMISGDWRGFFRRLHILEKYMDEIAVENLMVVRKRNDPLIKEKMLICWVQNWGAEATPETLITALYESGCRRGAEIVSLKTNTPLYIPDEWWNKNILIDMRGENDIPDNYFRLQTPYSNLESAATRFRNVFQTEKPVVILLYGMPGAGKSTLVRDLLLHNADTRNFTDGVYIFELRTSKDTYRPNMPIGDYINKVREKFLDVYLRDLIPKDPLGVDDDLSFLEVHRDEVQGALKFRKQLVILENAHAREDLVMRFLEEFNCNMLVTSYDSRTCDACTDIATVIKIEVNDGLSREQTISVLNTLAGETNTEAVDEVSELADLLDGYPLHTRSIASDRGAFKMFSGPRRQGIRWYRVLRKIHAHKSHLLKRFCPVPSHIGQFFTSLMELFWPCITDEPAKEKVIELCCLKHGTKITTKLLAKLWGADTYAADLENILHMSLLRPHKTDPNAYRIHYVVYDYVRGTNEEKLMDCNSRLADKFLPDIRPYVQTFRAPDADLDEYVVNVAFHLVNSDRISDAMTVISWAYCVDREGIGAAMAKAIDLCPMELPAAEAAKRIKKFLKQRLNQVNAVPAAAGSIFPEMKEDILGRNILHYSVLSETPTEAAAVKSMAESARAKDVLSERPTEAAAVKSMAESSSVKELINKADAFGQTPIYLAMRRDTLTIRIFLANDAKLDVCDYEKNTPIHQYVLMQPLNSLELIEPILKLVQAKAVDKPNKDGDTPVHLACRSFKTADSVLLSLARNRYNLGPQNNDGDTPHHVCVSAPGKASVEPFVGLMNDERMNVYKKNKKGENVFDAALKADPPSEPCLTILLNVLAKDTKGSSEDVRLAKEMVLKGAHIKEDNFAKGTLQFAARNSTELTEFLVNVGGDVNGITEYEHTVLINAVNARNIETVKFLLSKGADVNKPDKYGKTPLHCAFEMDRGGQPCNPQIVAILREAGANMQARDCQGMTPMMYSMGGRGGRGFMMDRYFYDMPPSMLKRGRKMDDYDY